MLKSLCPAVALALTLFSLPPRSVLPSRLRRFILTTACCRARPTQKRLPSIAARRLTAAPNHKVLRLPYHRRAYAITAAPALCRHACFTVMCCIATSADAACLAAKLSPRLHFIVARHLTLRLFFIAAPAHYRHALPLCSYTVTVMLAFPLRLFRRHSDHHAPRPHYYRSRARP